MAVGLQLHTHCGWDSPGFHALAAELCASTAFVAIAVASTIGGLLHRKGREKQKLDEQRTQVEKEQMLVRLRNSESELVAAREAHMESHRSWKVERDSLVSDFESRLCKAAEELQSCQRTLTEYQGCLDKANLPVAFADSNGLVTFWNEKCVEVFRCSQKRAVRRKLFEFFASGDATDFSLASIAAFATAKGDTASVVHWQKMLSAKARVVGEPWHEISLHVSIQQNANGRVEGLQCIGQDLTKLNMDRREAELETNDYVRLVSTINAPIIGVDSHGRINEWNRKAELLTGYSKTDAMGQNLVQNFISEEFADSVQLMVSQGLRGEDITNFEFSLFSKTGQRLEILMSASPRRRRDGTVIGVIGVGKDITELRSESKMLANYVRICGSAVWSLRGHSLSGAVTECKTKEIEHLISQQAQMDLCDPRMVTWRASFVSILKIMCQNFWMLRRKSSNDNASEKSGGTAPNTMERLGSSISSAAGESTSDFGYEFCFEAPNGQVKWYKVEGHLIEESLTEGKFEVTGSMHEVTSMWIDKMMGDRWQKWWSRMCHMVFDATLLVDTQEYRVLNAWGEEKVFGCKLQSHHPLLQLIKSDDTVSLKEAFNEVTAFGFERGRTLHLLRPNSMKEMPAQCFLLSADQENPNECMMGVRMLGSLPGEAECSSVLWDVAKPNKVLTLEDLARLKSGLKRHRQPSRPHRTSKHRPRSSGPIASSQSLCSIPEHLQGESEDDDDREDDLVKSDTESLRSSSRGSVGSESGSESGDAGSQVGVCNSSPPRSITDAAEMERFVLSGNSNSFSLSTKLQSKNNKKKDCVRRSPPRREGPLLVKLRYAKGNFDLNLDEFATIGALRAHIQASTSIPASRQTLILAGKRLPLGSEEASADEPTWDTLKNSTKPGQTLMLIGSVPSAAEAAAKNVPKCTSIQEAVVEVSEVCEEAAEQKAGEAGEFVIVPSSEPQARQEEEKEQPNQEEKDAEHCRE